MSPSKPSFLKLLLSGIFVPTGRGEQLTDMALLRPWLLQQGASNPLGVRFKLRLAPVRLRLLTYFLLTLGPVHSESMSAQQPTPWGYHSERFTRSDAINDTRPSFPGLPEKALPLINRTTAGITTLWPRIGGQQLVPHFPSQNPYKMNI